LLKPLNPVIEPGTDVPEEFTAELTPVTPIDLMGPTQFSLNVDRQYHWFGKDGGDRLFDQLFSDTRRDNVGIIQYEFDAIAKGVPQLAQTTIPVFGGKHLEPGTKAALMMQDADSGVGIPVAAPAIEILPDSEAHCWNRVLKPGQYCIKNK
jgi:hypothetical protein